MVADMDKEITKAFREYDKAYFRLLELRDKLFPAGSLVRSEMLGSVEAVVKQGSLYPDQVLTSIGHVSWRRLERINLPGDQR